MGGTSHKSTMHTGASLKIQSSGRQLAYTSTFKYVCNCALFTFLIIRYSVLNLLFWIIQQTPIRRLYNIRCNDENVDDNADVEYDDNNSPNDN